MGKSATVALPPQKDCGPTDGAGVLIIVSVLVSVAFPQGLFPVAVKVMVTLPAVTSAAPGVYNAGMEFLPMQIV